MKSKEEFRLAPGGNPSGYRLHTLTCLFLGFLFIAPVVAQEPSSKPEAPTPKTRQLTIPLPRKTAATTPPAKSVSEPDTLKDLQALAAEFLKYAAVVSCPKKDCTILVTNFVLPDGNTSPYGIQLADELSKELAGQNSKIRVIDRGYLQALLTKDRVPSKSINERLARSIAFALNATFVILGTTKKTDDDEVQLSTRLLDVADKDWSGYSAVINHLAPKSNVDLSPSEPFAALPQITSMANGESIYRPGVDGVSIPNCIYMPSPPYSEGARQSQLGGPFQLRPLSIPRVG